jgi:hypothetical protein
MKDRQFSTIIQAKKLVKGPAVFEKICFALQ